MTHDVEPLPLETIDLRARSPRWHRLPSTAWLVGNAVAEGLLVAALVSPVTAVLTFAAVLIAVIASIGSVVAAILEVLAYRKPGASITNGALALALNPYVVTGVLVNLGILDFG